MVDWLPAIITSYPISKLNGLYAYIHTYLPFEASITFTYTKCIITNPSIRTFYLIMGIIKPLSDICPSWSFRAMIHRTICSIPFWMDDEKGEGERKERDCHHHCLLGRSPTNIHTIHQNIDIVDLAYHSAHALYIA